MSIHKLHPKLFHVTRIESMLLEAFALSEFVNSKTGTFKKQNDYRLMIQ